MERTRRETGLTCDNNARNESVNEHVTPEPGRSRARRDQVLTAAATCFERSGFHGASMAELAKAAGMSVGHIYHYFDSKEAIIEAIVVRDLEIMLLLMDRVAAAGDIEQAMLGALRENLTCCAHRQLLRLEVLAEASRSPAIAARVQAADETARRRMKEVLAGHQRLLGLGHDELCGRVEAIAAVFEGLMVRALRDPGFQHERALRAAAIALRALIETGSAKA